MVRAISTAAVLLLACISVVSGSGSSESSLHSASNTFLTGVHQETHGVSGELVESIGKASDATAVKKSKTGTTVPKTYIVEFADDAEQQIAAAHNSNPRSSIKRSASDVNVHDEFHAFLEQSIADLRSSERKRRDLLDSILSNNEGAEVDKGYQTRFSWDSPKLFRGVSVELTSDSYAGLLSMGPGVAAVSPVGLHSPSHSKPIAVPKEFISKYVSKRSVANSSGGNSTDAYTPHVMVGIDRLHAEGIRGQNITIGIIDSGVGQYDSRSEPIPARRLSH